ncbi:MAG: LamG domain-containing protein [Promethearchaeota archaeon]
MPKKHRQKNACNPYRTILMVGAILLLTLFLGGFASAFDWSNTKAYYNFSSLQCSVSSPDNDLIAITGGGTIVSNATTFSLGDGKSAYFNGVGYYNNTPTLDEIFNLTDGVAHTEYTINYWVKAKTGTDMMISISKGTDGNGWDFFWDNSGKIGYRGATTTWSTNSTIRGNWAMITQIVNATDSCLYIDSVLDSCKGSSNYASSTTNYFEIGSSSSAGKNFTGYIDEVAFFSSSLSPTEIEELYNGGAGLLYTGGTSEPIIASTNLISPFNQSIITTIGKNFTAYFNISKGYVNWTNATYYIWDSDHTEFNKTLVTISTNNTYNKTYIDDFTLGSYEWNVYGCYANTTLTNCSWSSAGNYTFTVGAELTNVTYNNNTFETDRQNFSGVLNLLTGTSLYDVKLIYNSVEYDGSFIDLTGDNYLAYASIDIPTVTTQTNFTYYFKLIYSMEGGVFLIENSTSYNQTVFPISLYHCGAIANQTLNFTAYSEEDEINLTSFKFYGTFEYWLGNGNIRKNISISELNVTANYSLCISPNNLTYYSDAQIQYEKTGYVKRSYYLINATLTNTTQNIGLYLLNSSSSTSFIINVIDEVQFAIIDAYVYIQRYYPGSGIFHTIEMAKTDSSGNTIGHLEAETEDYKVIIFKDGQILYENEKAKVFCGETPCTLNFQTDAATPTIWQNIGDLPNLIWSLTYNETLKIWTYTYVDTSGTTSYGRLKVYIDDGNSRTIICNNSDTASASTLTCNVTDYDGTIYAEAYLSRSPEILVWLDSIIERSVKAIFGMEGLFWAVIILLIVGIIGIWNPSIGVIMLITGMIMINVLKLATLGITTILGIIVIGIIILWEIKK